MSNLTDRASTAAASYAAKKKDQLQRANALRAERESKSRHDSSSLSRMEKPRFDTGFDSQPSESMVVGGHEVTCKSYGDTTETISVRRPQSDSKPLPQMIPTASNSSRFHDMAEGKNEPNEKGRVNFFMPPADPSGQQVDLSDRPILCASYDSGKGEVIFGGADHALYSLIINGSDSNKPPRMTKMYSKRCGHTEWVTSVAHLKDGRVLSSGMDGKLCLWNASNRAICVDLIGGHTKSISKVLSSPTSNIALSCGYDANVVLWSFGGSESLESISTSTSTGSKSAIKSSVRKAPPSTSAQSVIMAGHAEAVVECALSGDAMAMSGDRLGGVVIWDLSTYSPIRNISKGHRGSITSVISLSHCSSDDSGVEIGPALFLTGGVDGIVRLWDPRVGGNKAALEIPAHAGISNAPPPTTNKPKSTTIVSNGKPTGKVGIAAAAVSCLAALTPKGGGDISGVITGGADSTICFLDARMSFQVVERWEHHRTGIYSMLAVGGDCVLTGDGAGMMHCYSTGMSGSSTTGLKYGLGCSEQGAVRAICKIGNKIITGGEDGKALVLTY